MTEDSGQILADEPVEMIDDDSEALDVTRGDEGYDDTEEGAIDDAPVPSVYSSEEVGGEEPSPAGEGS